MKLGRHLAAVTTAAFVALSAVAAEARVFTLPFGGIEGEQTLGTPLGVGDGLLVAGVINGQSGNYSNEVTFTLGAGATGIKSAANWFALSPIANSLSYALFDAADTLLADDVGPVFPGNGTVSSSLVFAGLTAGATYTIKIAGTIFGDAAAYQVAISITPIPAALLMLAPALAGLGYVGYRRRKAALSPSS